MSSGVGCTWGSDLALLWLWRRPSATVLIRPLAWEPPCAVGAALEKTKKKKINNNNDNNRSSYCGSVVMNLGSIPGLAQWVKGPALLCAVGWLQMQLGSHVAVPVV